MNTLNELFDLWGYSGRIYLNSETQIASFDPAKIGTTRFNDSIQQFTYMYSFQGESRTLTDKEINVIRYLGVDRAKLLPFGWQEADNLPARINNTYLLKY